MELKPKLEPKATIVNDISVDALKDCYITLSYVRFSFLRHETVSEERLLNDLQLFFQRSVDCCEDLQIKNKNNLALNNMLNFFQSNCQFIKKLKPESVSEE